MVGCRKRNLIGAKIKDVHLVGKKNNTDANEIFFERILTRIKL